MDGGVLVKSATPSMEDYLRSIYMLIQKKGYARSIDLAEQFNIRHPSVSKMIQKLGDENYLRYEKYRGFTLTPLGEELGEWCMYRNNILQAFLEVIGVHFENIEEEADKMEHYVSEESLAMMASTTAYFQENTIILQELRSKQQKKNTLLL